jgi:lipid A 3-O-deacylase
VRAAGGAVKSPEFQLFIENDSWGNSDSHYTSGLKFGVGATTERVSPLLRFIRWANDCTNEREGEGSEFCGTPHVGLFVGQNMYTPRSITTSTPQPFDRPWAAWLYMGAAAQYRTATSLSTAEFDLGVVGPAALGKEIQTAWHALPFINAPTPKGWQHQLPNEVGFLLSYLRKNRFGDRAFQFIPHVGFSAGTIATFARAGGMARVGINMTGFGPDSIEPGGASLQNTPHASEEERRRGFEIYGFVGVDVRYVARNVFLDGTLFRDSPSVDRRNVVGDLSHGFSARCGPFRFALTRVRRSEEFTTAFGPGGTQRYASINIGLELQEDDRTWPARFRACTSSFGR